MRIVTSAMLAAVVASIGGMGGVALAQGAAAPAIVRGSYTVEPFTPSAPVTIQGTGVRLRAEPFASKDTPVLSSGSTGMQLTIVGIARQPDWDWYQVVLRNGQKAFIRSDLTTAPSRGNAGVTPPAAQPQPPVQPPQIAYVPPRQPEPTLPLPATQPAQPLPPIPTRPVNSGAISLTPGAATPQLGPAPVATRPAPPADNGLLSVSPAAPTPRFSDPAPAPAAPVTASTLPSTMASLGVAEQIRAQLNVNRCWTDSSSMMDAQRLKASFGVSFGPDGRFAAEPRLISPSAEPANDPAMMVFLAKARAAMRTCNAIGFYVPPAYYSGDQVELVLEFSAR